MCGEKQVLSKRSPAKVSLSSGKESARAEINLPGLGGRLGNRENFLLLGAADEIYSTLEILDAVVAFLFFSAPTAVWAHTHTYTT